MGTLITGIVVAVLVGTAVRSIVRAKKKGKCCGCSGCDGHCNG